MKIALPVDLQLQITSSNMSLNEWLSPKYIPAASAVPNISTDQSTTIRSPCVLSCHGVILGIVIVVIIAMDICFILFAGAYSHAEIRTLSRTHCRPSKERMKYLNRGGKSMGMREIINLGIFQDFVVGEMSRKDMQETDRIRGLGTLDRHVPNTGRSAGAFIGYLVNLGSSHLIRM